MPASPRTPGGILFGVDEQTRQLVELDLFDHRVCLNANVGIFAPSGGGKTFFTKVLARRYLLLTDTTDVIIIDRKQVPRPVRNHGRPVSARCSILAAPYQSIRPATPDPTGEGSALLDHP